jgi:hypothetical protein
MTLHVGWSSIWLININQFLSTIIKLWENNDKFKPNAISIGKKTIIIAHFFFMIAYKNRVMKFLSINN